MKFYSEQAVCPFIYRYLDHRESRWSTSFLNCQNGPEKKWVVDNLNNLSIYIISTKSWTFLLMFIQCWILIKFLASRSVIAKLDQNLLLLVGYLCSQASNCMRSKVKPHGFPVFRDFACYNLYYVCLATPKCMRFEAHLHGNDLFVPNASFYICFSSKNIKNMQFYETK